MTDQTKVLELAKECGIVVVPNTKPISVQGLWSDFERFAAALEAEHLAQIAMLKVALVECAVPLRGMDMRLHSELAKHEVLNAIQKADAAILTTQQTADAFFAERDARILEKAADKIFVIENGWGEWSIQHARRDFYELAAEKRNSAAQPEGREPQ